MQHPPCPLQPWKQPFDLLIVFIHVFFYFYVNKMEPSSLICPTQSGTVNVPRAQAVIKTLCSYHFFTHPGVTVETEAGL